MDFPATKLTYFDGMWTLYSTASSPSLCWLAYTRISVGKMMIEGGRSVSYGVGIDRFPSSRRRTAVRHGLISDASGEFKFRVQDVRSRNGVVLHFGCFDPPHPESSLALDKGRGATLHVDGERRKLNSRLHSAGHLLDICMRNVGLLHFKPGKGNNFPDGSFVEYKGVVPQNELQKWAIELEDEANRLISIGGKLLMTDTDEHPKNCGILGNNLGCPCGGTHVANISDIKSIKIPQIRNKKGMTKVLYSINS